MTTTTPTLREQADAARAEKRRYYHVAEIERRARTLRQLPTKARLAIVVLKRFTRTYGVWSAESANHHQHTNAINEARNVLLNQPYIRKLERLNSRQKIAIAQTMHWHAEQLRKVLGTPSRAIPRRSTIHDDAPEYVYVSF